MGKIIDGRKRNKYLRENQDFSIFLDSALPESAQICAFCPKMVNTQRRNVKTDQICRD